MANREKKIRVVIADDHRLVRQGIRALLERTPDIEVVGEASDGLEAIAKVEELQPDLVIMDISMPQMDGIQATEYISKMDVPTRIMVLSMYSKPSIVQQVLRKGAKGYLLKNSISEELTLAIHAALRNEIYLSPSISSLLLDNILNAPEEGGDRRIADRLTITEREVLQFIAQGFSSNEIAQNLKISEESVDKYSTSLMSKLHVQDRLSLLREAIKHNLIFVD
ncbi:MAG: response regulator transcription factor [Chloroflexi bacterium]|nr:response regulator transcription factor [Chloroflexota bacterium]MBP8058493.1 response regulator transcription factor [Chloroflexota bacterium]